MEENNNIEDKNIEESKPEPTPEPVRSVEPVETKPKEKSALEKKLEAKFGSKMPSFKFKLDLNVKAWPAKIMHTLREYKRVIIVSRKPDIEELSEISKISAIGLLLVGFIGFLLQTIFQLFV